jgi:hypothetical protein
MNYCFLNGLFSGVPQKYDKLGSLIVVHDLPGLVAQNGNGQLSVVAVGFFFSFAAACGTAPTKKKPAATPTVNALINFDFIVSSSSFCACGSRHLLRVRSQRPRNRHASNKIDELAPPHGRPHGSGQGIVAVHMRLVKRMTDVRFGSLADKPPMAKIHLLSLWSNSAQTRARLNCSLCASFCRE